MSSVVFSDMAEDAAVRLYLEHHGIKGQKWGLRRWQNEDGSLTPAGRQHYGYGTGSGQGGDGPSERSKAEAMKLTNKVQKANSAQQKALRTGSHNVRKNEKLQKKSAKLRDEIKNSPQIEMTKYAMKQSNDKWTEAQSKVDKLEKKFLDNKELFEEYATKSIDKRLSQYMSQNGILDTNSSQYKYLRDKYSDYYKNTRDGIEDVLSEFANSGNKKARAYNEAVKQLREANIERREETKKYISQFTGDFGNTTLSSFGYSTTTVNDYLSRFID